MHGAHFRLRRCAFLFLRSFHAASVGFSRLAFDPPHRFRMCFPLA